MKQWPIEISGLRLQQSQPGLRTGPCLPLEHQECNKKNHSHFSRLTYSRFGRRLENTNMLNVFLLKSGVMSMLSI